MTIKNQQKLEEQVKLYGEWITLAFAKRTEMNLDHTWRPLENGKFRRGASNDYHKEFTKVCFTPWNEYYKQNRSW